MIVKTDRHMKELSKTEFAEEFANRSGRIADVIKAVAEEGAGNDARCQTGYAANQDYAARCFNRDVLVINQNLDDCAMYAVCHALKHEYGIEEIDAEKFERFTLSLSFKLFSHIEDVIADAFSIISTHGD